MSNRAGGTGDATDDSPEHAMGDWNPAATRHYDQENGKPDTGRVAHQTEPEAGRLDELFLARLNRFVCLLSRVKAHDLGVPLRQVVLTIYHPSILTKRLVM